MITWLSDHYESDVTGKTRLVKIGQGDQEFWDRFPEEEPLWAARGVLPFNTSKGRFLKFYMGKDQAPPALKLPAKIKLPPWLRDFQVKHVCNMLDVYTENTTGGDFSDTGTGKTYTTLALALLFKRPVFIVCLMAGMDKWQALCKQFGVKVICIGNYEAFKGDNEFGKMSATFSPYEILRRTTGKKDEKFHCPFPRHKVFKTYEEAKAYLFENTYLKQGYLDRWEYENGKKLKTLCRKIAGFEWNLPKDAFVIFDEVHKCKSEDSQNMRLLAAAKPYLNICLSATPGVTPRDFKALGYDLGLHNFYDFDLWTEKYGCQRLYSSGSVKKFIGWNYSKKSQGLEKLNTELYPRHAARMRISDIPNFPKTVITAECFSSKEAPHINELYAELVKKCKSEVKGKKLLEVTAILRYRMLVEKLKMPLFKELITEAHDNNFSVALFINFKENMLAMREHYPEAPYIVGAQKRSEREAMRLRFELNEANLILVNSEAGGTSLDLHDLYGDHPRMSLISPTYNPYTLKQIFGRVQRDGSKSTSFQRIVYVGGTQEEKVCAKVREKIKAFDTVNGDLIQVSDLIEDVVLTNVNLPELEKTEEEEENIEEEEITT